jgi:hypothetical protein
MKAPEYDGVAIVMIGSFNPAIFQPRWLGTQGVIMKEEAENAKIVIIQADLADFSTDWFQLQVLQNRFQIVSNDPRQYAPLRDLAMSVFTILPHTPVKTFGITRQLHFKMSSEAEWHRIGDALAPKELWKPMMQKPGLRSMLMQGHRPQADGGILHIKVEPSLKVAHGVYLEVNEEFKAPCDDETDGARWVPESLSRHWDSLLAYSDGAAEWLVEFLR